MMVFSRFLSPATAGARRATQEAKPKAKQAKQMWITGLAIALTLPTAAFHAATAQTPPPAGQPLRLEADVTEANAVTGVITARGNVRITYPARQIQATAVQAQYFSRERRIVLSGNVYVLQEGNSLRGEVVTYLVDEGRFLALPDRGQQVEAIYIVPDPNPTTGSNPAAPPDFNPKPEFKLPESPE
jgi:lipopolysaccharide export system protein LptA